MNLSVVCPVYNEEKHIEPVLAFFVKSLPADKELLVIDGGSQDRTRSIVENWSQRYPNITLLDNPEKYVSFALNKAIPRCQGNFIVRLDAHTEYADDYFEKILDTFSRTDADIVGGPMRAKGITAFQKAVAYCTSTPMGVGDSSFHNESAEGYVDSVYLGAWRRTIFDKTGLFDVQMVRNQDDEFHYRAKSLGHKIYLNPAIRSVYYPRNNLSALFSQYFQYGLYKPLVLRKVSSEIKIRHLVPSAFVLYLLFLPAAALLVGTVAWIPLALYLAGCIYFTAVFKEPLNVKIHCFVIYPALHIAYGTGFLSGLFRRRAKKLT